MKKLSYICLAAGLLIAAAGVRFALLGDSPFRTDTMEFYKLAKNNANPVEIWKNPPWVNQIPLNEVLCLLAIKAGLPPTPFVVRLPFAVMGMLGVVFVWLLARGHFGKGAALMALWLAAWNPYQVYFSRTAYHYAGAAGWGAVMFFFFWAVWRDLAGRRPVRKSIMLGWAVSTVVACLMHMSVWIVALAQAGLLVFAGFRAERSVRKRFFALFSGSAALIALFMFRWVVRAVKAVLIVSGEGGTGHFGAPVWPEIARLLPAYFAGQNLLAVGLLFVVAGLSAAACFGAGDPVRKFRQLAAVSLVQLVAALVYVIVIGGGVAKIAYFSAVWPQMMLVLGVGFVLGIQRIGARAVRIALYVLVPAAYLALTAVPVQAIVRLEGKPTPYYKINDWMLKNVSAGTPILTDRWLDPWNELAVHNPGNINYAFTVPDEPLQNYIRFNWRRTAEQFFEKYPDAAFLELSRGRWDAECGPWAFKTNYFARITAVTNEPAMVLRKWKVFPQEEFSLANTNRVVVRIFYNTTDDLLAAARRAGRDTLRLYGEGWGYAKPGWQQGQFEDFRTMKKAAALELYNLTAAPLSGSLEITAAAAGRAKSVTASGASTVFAPNRMRGWTVPAVLQPGRNTIPLASPSDDPLFVLDVRWRR